MKKFIFVFILLLSLSLISKSQLFLIDVKNIPDTVKLSSWVEIKSLTISAVNCVVSSIDNRIWTFHFFFKVYRNKKHYDNYKGDGLDISDFLVRQYQYDNAGAVKPDVFLKNEIKADIKNKFKVQDSDIIFY